MWEGLNNVRDCLVKASLNIAISVLKLPSSIQSGDESFDFCLKYYNSCIEMYKFPAMSTNEFTSSVNYVSNQKQYENELESGAVDIVRCLVGEYTIVEKLLREYLQTLAQLNTDVVTNAANDESFGLCAIALGDLEYINATYLKSERPAKDKFVHKKCYLDDVIEHCERLSYLYSKIIPISRVVLVSQSNALLELGVTRLSLRCDQTTHSNIVAKSVYMFELNSIIHGLLSDVTLKSIACRLGESSKIPNDGN